MTYISYVFTNKIHKPKGGFRPNGILLIFKRVIYLSTLYVCYIHLIILCISCRIEGGEPEMIQFLPVAAAQQHFRCCFQGFSATATIFGVSSTESLPQHRLLLLRWILYCSIGNCWFYYGFLYAAMISIETKSEFLRAPNEMAIRLHFALKL